MCHEVERLRWHTRDLSKTVCDPLVAEIRLVC